MVSQGKLWIGTSGWSYRHWRGNFYVSGLPPEEEFAFYCCHFNTVELNNSFYRLPLASTFSNWRQHSPAGFLFAVKASRFITHTKKLIDPAEPLQLLLGRARHLGRKFGPLLFQLPPKWAYNGQRFAAFLATLPREHVCICEFRNHTWFNDHAYGLMRAAGVGLCLYDLAGFASPRVLTSSTVYVRLHGPHGAYAGSYSEDELTAWADAIREWRGQGRDIHCYFDNDQMAHAPRNALTLKAMLRDDSERP